MQRWGQGTKVDRLDVRTGGGWRFVSNPGTDKESAVSGWARLDAVLKRLAAG